MNLLESFEKEIETDTKIICLTPYDRDFSFKFLSLKKYLECENLSDLWTTGFVEEFEYSYHGESKLIHQLEEHHFKRLIEKFSSEDDVDFEELSLDVLRWQFNYNDDVEVYFHHYNYFIKQEDKEHNYYYDEKDLVQDLFEEQTGIELQDLQVKHDCLKISICAECFFNQGSWYEIDYKEFEKLKIEFVDT